jgi:hypothetical protein
VPSEMTVRLGYRQSFTGREALEDNRAAPRLELALRLAGEWIKKTDQNQETLVRFSQNWSVEIENFGK